MKSEHTQTHLSCTLESPEAQMSQGVFLGGGATLGKSAHKAALQGPVTLKGAKSVQQRR